MTSHLSSNHGLISASFLVPDDASRAIGALHDRGVTTQQISIATRNGAGDGEYTDAVVPSDAPSVPRERDGFLEIEVVSSPVPTDMNAATDSRIGGSSTSASSSSPIATAGEIGLTTTTPADAARGAVEGGAIGLGIGLLAGSAALVIPGFGLIMAAGPLFLALAGAAGATAAGAAAGGVAGYLCDRGIPADSAAYHADRLAAGSVVVTVHLNGHASEDSVRDVFIKYGGSHVVVTPMSAS